MVVKAGDRVKVDYVLTVDGRVYDTSMEEEAKLNNVYNFEREYKPLEFEVGNGEVVYGLSKGVKGMSVGEVREIIVSPVEGYGFYNENYVRKIPRSLVEKQGVEVYPGVKLMINTPKGAMTAVVAEMDEENVVFDMNHDLSGKTLCFKVFLRDIVAKKVESNW